MRRFVFAMAGVALVTAGLAVAAAGCESFSGSATDESDARNEATAEETGTVGGDAAPDSAARVLTPIYGRAFGSATDAGEAGAQIFPSGMAVDPSGGLALVGTYGYGSVDVGGSTLPVPNGADAFLLRLDGAGDVLLAKPFTADKDQYGARLAGSNGTLYASFEVDGTMTYALADAFSSQGSAGRFNSATVRFTAATFSSGLVSFKSASNVLVKGTALGAADSVLSFGDWDDAISVNGMSSVARDPGKLGLFLVRSFIVGGSQDIVRTNLCDNGTTCVASALAANPQNGESLAGGRYTGHITGTVDGGITTALNDNDGYVMKLDANLVLQWVVALGGTGLEEVLAATTMGSDFVVAGSFDGSLDLPGQPKNVTAGKTDVFVARLDGAGKVVWVRTFGGSGTDRVRAITADAAGNIFVAGQFNGPTLEIQGTKLTNADVVGRGTNDAFVAWLDGSGNAVYSVRFGDGADDDVAAIGLDGLGNLAIAGAFEHAIDFGKGPLTARGRQDTFVAKFGR